MDKAQEAAFAADDIVVLKEIEGGDVIALYRFFASTGLLRMPGDYIGAIDRGWNGHKRRFCYKDTYDALMAGIAWDGEGDPPGRWIKDKSPGQDRLNPLFGTALFDGV